MKYLHPLNQIRSRTRPYWDRDDTRPAVREALRKAEQCRTPALGAEVYSSENRELIVPHTCKSRACPSCGHRSNKQWLRERWSALPDANYNAVTFSMPDLLWPYFRDNPVLARTLPALASEVIRSQVGIRRGVRVGVIAILHTFNGKLEFNSHVHTIVTAGGLRSSDSWDSRVYFDRDSLMKSWRKAVVALLRAALKAGVLRCDLAAYQMDDLLTYVARRWWSVNIKLFEDKWHFLQYAGRYVRRPPIAQYRITWIGERTVKFWYKKKFKYLGKTLFRRIEVECTLEEFVDRWTQHLPNRYHHAVRNFGLFAPRAIGQTSATIFNLLGQKQRPRPKPLRWADSIKRDFGYDPLLDCAGKRLKWMRRIAPTASR